MLVKAYFQCDIDGCTNTHEVSDIPRSYGNFIEKPRAHTYKNIITHISENVPSYLAEESIDICQEHYDIIRNGEALIIMQDKKIFLREVKHG